MTWHAGGWWRDTLFKRLFLLMCVAILASHVAAFGVVMRLIPVQDWPRSVDATGAPDAGSFGAHPPARSMPPVPGRRSAR